MIADMCEKHQIVYDGEGGSTINQIGIGVLSYFSI
ncbi:hypothetical protein NSE_0437 [Neorickettsia sennetsu str. Miyayama]|uniref:Uncharacterized protein n=1 Tax=Ehrlichia sennetsu (strain ATCC VR-367 / Miyayama) TaxID=222891 RepID=Q2GDX4_EHRS3|nr:hypothetical protein NSE_0437 [Neorickettsia sennetsu str. Miyayama]